MFLKENVWNKHIPSIIFDADTFQVPEKIFDNLEV